MFLINHKSLPSIRFIQLHLQANLLHFTSRARTTSRFTYHIPRRPCFISNTPWDIYNYGFSICVDYFVYALSFLSAFLHCSSGFCLILIYRCGSASQLSLAGARVPRFSGGIFPFDSIMARPNLYFFYSLAFNLLLLSWPKELACIRWCSHM